MTQTSTLHPLLSGAPESVQTKTGRAYRAWASLTTLCGGGVFQIGDIAASIPSSDRDRRATYAAEVIARATFEWLLGSLLDGEDSHIDVGVGMLVRDCLGVDVLALAISICEAHGVPLRGR